MLKPWQIFKTWSFIGYWWILFIFRLNILREIIGLENHKLFDILNYIKRIDSFPTEPITYKIILRILVSIALGKMNFSKLKIIKKHI